MGFKLGLRLRKNSAQSIAELNGTAERAALENLTGIKALARRGD